MCAGEGFYRDGGQRVILELFEWVDKYLPQCIKNKAY